jgi:NAD(P)-dependent dehydrogenase (short-subunit alcohol dehydrogenase family)
MSNNLLSGKVIIVTGAGGGIGAEIARAVALHGAKVVVNDIGVSTAGEGGDNQPARSVADSICRGGGEAVPSFHSVSSAQGGERIIKDALEAFGRLDGIVNNAGILRDTFFHKMSVDAWQAVIDVNLSGCFYVARAAANLFKEQGSGSFVHLTSTSGLIGSRGQANYAAAKMGVAGLSRAIAMDMERFGVRSNCIAPFAFTRMVGSIKAETDEMRRKLELSKERNTPAKIAPLAAVLLSDAARDISGQIFGVRANEVMIFNQPRPVRTVHTSEGWTAQRLIDTALPAMRPSMTKLEGTVEYFSWDPV